MGMENRNNLTIQVCLMVTLILSSSLSFSQDSLKCDLRFIDHLVNAGDYKEALFLLDSTDCSSDQMNDSVNYLRGWSLYSLKRLKESSTSLIKVSPISEFYLKSHFFAAYNYAHTGNYNNALKVLSEINVKGDKQLSLKNYERAGFYLLRGDISMYDKSLAGISVEQYEISESFSNLQKISLDFKIHRKKSPVFAGILSGIIPGSGKFYAGKRGEAVSSFLATTGLGLITWENYRKSGLNSFKTIAFGTAFAVSYIANIYGAVVTVSLLETEYKDNVRNSILFNLHIPLRNTFSK
jgi:TM2 domain-containing membrane protein YozV